MITTLKPRSNHSVTLHVRFHGVKNKDTGGIGLFKTPTNYSSRFLIIAGITLLLIAGTLSSVWAQDSVQQLAQQAIAAARTITDSSVPAQKKSDSKDKDGGNPLQKGKPQEAESRKTVKAQECYTHENGEKECVEYLVDAETGEPVEKWVGPAPEKKEDSAGNTSQQPTAGSSQQGQPETSNENSAQTP